MKATKGQLDALRAVCVPLDTTDARARYRAGDFARADKCRDVYMRYRWDIFYSARGWDALVLPGMGDSGDVAARTGGLTGEHIDTMLRSIVSAL